MNRFSNERLETDRLVYKRAISCVAVQPANNVVERWHKRERDLHPILLFMHVLLKVRSTLMCLEESRRRGSKSLTESPGPTRLSGGIYEGPKLNTLAMDSLSLTPNTFQIRAHNRAATSQTERLVSSQVVRKGRAAIMRDGHTGERPS